MMEAESEETIYEILETYDEYLFLDEDKVKPRIENAVYRRLTNKDRIYVSEGYAHKVMDDSYLLITPAKNIRELRKQESIVDYDKDLFELRQYANFEVTDSQGRSLASCGGLESVFYVRDESGCNNDRRGESIARADWIISFNNYTPALIAQGLAERKIICVWVLYDTSIHSKDVFARLRWSVNGIQDNRSLYIADKNTYSHRLWVWNGAWAGSVYWHGGSTPWIYLDEVYQPISTGGIGTNYAIIDCG